MNTPVQSPAEPTLFDDGDEYDIFFAEFDYGLDFYLQLARTARGPVLDVACGTGRVLLPCLRAGFYVDGLDLFAPMLSTLRRKAVALGFEPRLYQASMSSFHLDRRYALIMLPFNAFVHNLTTHDQIATLTCCREHLEPGGLLAFDTYFPGVHIINSVENQRVLEIEVPHPATGFPVRMFDTRSFNRVEQLQNSINEIETLDAAGNVTASRRSRTALRWVYKFEMELLLRVAGFDRWEVFGGFDGRPLIHETDAMIVKAWNARGA